MQPLASSMIAAAGYDEEAQVLQVRFKNGATYAYDGVPEDDYHDLISAGSAGSFFHDNIKDAYPSRRV